ncbi:sulfite exporter TauE/SafE family protein [Salinirubellus sp. GCM10025818]|uniref:sulfite exporter TauE/SafE family protein n=1 Tax=Salinirubellus TaxID=2162630 RepID=UPI0030CC09D7
MPGAGPELGLVAFLAIGLLGGVHCLGMCGPLVTLYADRMATDPGPRADGGTVEGGRGYASPDRGPTFRELRQHLLFNLGRTLAYATVGATMGALGGLVYDTAAVAAVAGPVRGVTGVVVGLLVVAAGVTNLRGEQGGHLPVGGLFGRVSAALTSRVDRWVRGPRIVALGAIHGLMPCPILYPAFLYALAVGSPVHGALALALLGIGTVPTLFAYGTVLGSLSPGTRERLHRVLGALFVLLGYLPLAMGLAQFGVTLPMPEVPFYQPLA